jgi:hypothetical protein
LVSPLLSGELDYYPGIIIDCQGLEVPGHFLMRRAVALLASVGALSCIVLLGGCWNGRALYSFERPFLSSLGDETGLRVSLIRAALSNGYLPRFDTGDAVEPVAGLLRSTAAGGYAVAIVGPLLSFQWSEFVPAVPGTEFVLIGVPAPQGDAPKNAVFLTFDRVPAFREAGRAAGESVRVSAASGAPLSLLGARVGVIAAERSGLAPSEADAFALGVADALNGAQPVSRTLAATPEPDAIRAAVSQMRGEGVEVFLLGLGERDPVGLEALRDSGGVAVVSDWEASGALPAQVLASVEEDVPGGIAQALAAAKSGARRAEGPVRVVRGRKI